MWISNCAWIFLHFHVGTLVLYHRPSGWECRTSGVADDTVLLAGVGGCHGPRESVVRVCACGEVTSLQIRWAWNFLTNSIQTSLALSRAQIHPVFHLSPHKWSHNTPIRTSTPLIFGGVLMLWQEGCSPSGTFSTERNSWTRKNPSRWNSKIFPRINTYLVTHLHRVSYARMINRVTISLSVLRTVVCLLAFECSTDGHTWRIIRRTDTHTVHELFDGQTIL